ncbi:choice-of-anchor L domain-containing protein [Mesonia sp. K7]|uniref:choice-of-anchor L domain-containing protein n=1 Tax=Mesonia sp. K7 TaxID=2218606 RepID=UPI000DA9A2DE|nr:choice-of-anchor L domain-containing protein [Mesonia sp. K7]PZD76810.1 hypothetical protein DNG35_10660 [Mesonia sp. K7]
MIKISRHISIIILLFFSLNELTAQNIYIGTGDIHYECSGYFFDNGGENGYSEDDGVVTLCPNNTGNSIKIDFTNYSFLLAQGDVLKIYDGTSVSAPLIGEYTTVNNPGLVLPTIANTSGCLTFEFITDGNISPVPGWKASIDCQDCPDINFEINVSPSEIIPNGYRVEKGVPITFDVDIPNATYFWDFGDGATASGQSVTHTFNPNPQNAQEGLLGTYQVKLIVTTANGCLYSIVYTFEVTHYRVVIDENYSVDELIEDVFITGNCGNVTNIHSPSNAILGGFGLHSLGYFEKAYSNFPFEDGIVLSTSYIDYVPEGPNSGGGWPGDTDLNTIASPTYDATSIVFEFTPYISEINFEYIFASYEYPQYICNFADTFAFILSGPGINNINAYDHDANPNTPDVNLDLGGLNIALIPGTNIPVSVTNIHQQIDCPGTNSLGEYYTDAYYDYAADGHGTSGIDMYGQTVPLTATAQVVPGETYTIKLVVADYGDRRYQSAVFLKGQSFTLGPDLGEDIISNNENITLPCEGESIILNPFENVQTIIGLTYEWYKDGVLLQGETGETLEVTEEGTYVVYVYFDNNCAGTDEIIVEFLPQPNLKEGTLASCDNGFGENVFDLLAVKDDILLNQSSSDFSFFFYLTEGDAILNIESNRIQNPDEYYSEDNVIWVRVENDEGCYAITSIELVLLQRPAINSTAITKYLCEYTETGLSTIDLTQYNEMINPDTSNGTEVIYYATADAYENGEAINNPSTYSTISNPQTLIAQVINTSNFCTSLEVTELTIHTLNFPEVDISRYHGAVICLDKNPLTPVYGGNYETLPIHTDLPADGTYLFQWIYNGQPIENDTPSLIIDQAGTYEIEVTHVESGCTSSSKATIIESNPPEFNISPLTFVFSENNSLEVYSISGSGDYEFRIGNSSWVDIGGQDRLVFDGISSGEHIVEGRDKYGCGVTRHSIVFVSYPKFFTPNQDGYNDYWSLSDIHYNYDTINITQIWIFDRYGKLLTTFPPHGRWDGTYNGQPLPSNDYWFKVEYVVLLPNGIKERKIFKANLTLKR